MSLKFPDELTINGTEWTYKPFRFNVNKINAGKSEPSWKDVILSGSGLLTLINAKANGLNYVKLFGKCEQSGTPQPDTPMDIWCNNGTVKCNTNIFTTTGATQDKYIDVNGQEQNGVYQGYSFAHTNYLKVKPNTTYTVSGVSKVTLVTNHWVSAWSSNKTFIGRLVNLAFPSNSIGNEYSVTFTTTAETEYIMFNYVYTVDEEIKIYLNAYSLNEIYADGIQETVSVTGKNLYDGTITHFAFLANTRVVTYNQEYMGITIPVKAGKIYTFSRQYLPESKSTNRFTFYYTQEYPREGIDVYNVSSAPTDSLTRTFTVPDNMNYVVFYFDIGGVDISNTKMMVELGSTATEYEPYFNGGNASAEMLLGLDQYKDEQNITTGDITRNIGIAVLDGSIEWTYKSLGSGIARVYIRPTRPGDTDLALCSHAALTSVSERTRARDPNTFQFGILTSSNEPYLGFKLNESEFADATAWKQYLASQYTNGTPVIIVYPLETPTTESVTPQPLRIQAGTNTITAEGSIDNLPLEVSYKAGVTVTITEVQNAQLSNNVEVTIQ